jgi:hypothetical protein
MDNTTTNTITTNEIKKGERIQLRNGWMATMFDNARGNTRMAEVEGIYKEIGSVYSHDIITVIRNGAAYPVTHTPAQIKLKKQVNALGF